jgi:membrane-associated protease RseP (regulator of RpoE activity)
MRRFCWLLSAGLLTLPLAAAASPDPARSEHYSWSFSSGKGRLGVVVMSLTPELRNYFGTPDDRGLLVAHVDPGSPAAAADLRPGDVITDVKGEPVERVVDVVSALEPTKKGDDVAVAVVREHKTLTVHAVMADPPKRMHGSSHRPEDLQNMPPEVEKMMRNLMREWPWSEVWHHHTDSTDGDTT